LNVKVDLKPCVLRGECVAPEQFDIDNDAEWVIVLDPEPGEHQRETVEHAALMCPLGATTVEEKM
jgi:ferredoxin